MTAWLIETALATSFLIGAILLVRRPVARAFGPRIAYALWLIPALRMILPPLPESWFGLSVSLVPFVPDAGSGWINSVFSVWAIGAMLFFTWHVAAYRRFSKRMRAVALCVDSHDHVEIKESALVTSPLAFGLVVKTVMLPSDFKSRYTAREQEFALRHELSHHGRNDLVANVFALAFLAANWFNPLAHLAIRAFRNDQEAACDATVLRSAAPDDYHVYGSALVKSALGSVPMMACPIGVSANVKERLEHLIAARDVAPLYHSGLTLCGVLAVAGLGLTASVTPEIASQKSLKLAGRTAQPIATLRSPVGHKALQPIADHQPVLTKSEDEQTLPPSVAGKTEPAAKPLAVLAIKTAETLPSPVVTELPTAPAAPRAVEKPKIIPAALEPRVPATNDAEAGLPCNGEKPAMRVEGVFYRDGRQTGYTLNFCGQGPKDPAQRKTAMLQGLQATRNRVANDPRLPPEARADIVEALDTQIAALNDGTV